MVLLEHAHESEGVIPETRGELLVESLGDADETEIVLEGHVRRDESEPVGAGCGLLVRRRQRDGIPCFHGFWFLVSGFWFLVSEVVSVVCTV